MLCRMVAFTFNLLPVYLYSRFTNTFTSDVKESGASESRKSEWNRVRGEQKPSNRLRLREKSNGCVAQPVIRRVPNLQTPNSAHCDAGVGSPPSRRGGCRLSCRLLSVPRRRHVCPSYRNNRTKSATSSESPTIVRRERVETADIKQRTTSDSSRERITVAVGESPERRVFLPTARMRGVTGAWHSQHIVDVRT